MLERDISREVARLTQTREDWEKIRTLENNVTRLQRKDKHDFYRQMYTNAEEENDPAKLFSMSKKLLGWKRSEAPKSFLQDGRQVHTQKEVANIQAKFYDDKVDGIKLRLPRVRRDPLQHLKKAFGNIEKLKIEKVTEDEVLKIIKKTFKNSYAFGRDMLDVASIKKGAKTLVRPITFVINLSLGTNKFPAKWKIARVLPILKSKGAATTNPASFRPISQLPVISKIAEKCVQSRLLLHLEKYGLLSADHHGYRRNLSTTSALLEIMDAISTATGYESSHKYHEH